MGKLIDETGHKYGKWTVIEPARLPNGKSGWLCQCECGNICKVPSTWLTQGTKKSCGCLKSYGEKQIEILLKEHNINYQSQFFFDDFRGENKQPYRFDFAIFNSDGTISHLIEYDGEQHFSYKQDNGWNNKENFLKTQKRDTMKNEYCKQHNIPLIRIRYDQEYNFEDLMLDGIRGADKL